MSAGLAEVAEDAAPLHRRLKASILALVRSGEWAPGARISSERELCERFGVSRTTARRAIADLSHAGVLVAAAGKGTFVARAPVRQELQPLVGFAEDLGGQGLDVRAVVLDLRRLEAPADMAGALGLRPLAPVVRLSRLRLAGDAPLAVQTSWLPEHLCPGLARLSFERRSLYATLRFDYGLHLAGASTVIQAGAADASEAQRLALRPGAPVLRTFQTTRLAGGAVAERCEASFAGDRFQLTVGGAGAVSAVYAAADADDAGGATGGEG